MLRVLSYLKELPIPYLRCLLMENITIVLYRETRTYNSIAALAFDYYHYHQDVLAQAAGSLHSRCISPYKIVKLILLFL